MTHARRDRVVAFLLGFFPGLGHVYARRPGRGFVVAILFSFVLFPGSDLAFSAASSAATIYASDVLAALVLLAGPVDAAIIATGRERRPRVPWWTWLAHVVCVFLIFAMAVEGVANHLPLDRSYVSTVGMVPTVLAGDTVTIDTRRVRLSTLHAGDIVLIDNPDQPGTPILKRVAALPGDFVEVRDGILVLNGQKAGSAADRPADGEMVETLGGRSWRIYLTPQAPVDWPRTEVPPGSLFVLGDNRYNSSDSRTYGSVPEHSLRGRALRINGSVDPESGKTRWERIGLSLLPGPEAH